MYIVDFCESITAIVIKCTIPGKTKIFSIQEKLPSIKL